MIKISYILYTKSLFSLKGVGQPSVLCAVISEKKSTSIVISFCVYETQLTD